MNLINVFKKSEIGQSLVEVIVSMAILSVVFASSWQILHSSYMSLEQELIGLKAHYLVIGGLEGIKSVRDEDWNAIIDGTWHFTYDETDPDNKFLLLVVGEETIFNAYHRRIEISSVRRDDNGKITEDISYEIDEDTKLVEVVVHWDFLGETHTDIERIYLTKVVEALYG